MNSVGSVLRALAIFLAGQRIKYAVLGGFAVSVHGEPRFTADVDINIILEKNHLGRFIESGGKYGFRPAFPTALKIAEKTGVVLMKCVKSPSPVTIEFIVAENPLEYAAIKRARMQKIGPAKLKVITAEDLLIHKLASSRAKDREDVGGILARQTKRLDLKYIRDWLKRIDKANKTHINTKFNKLLFKT